MSDMTDADESLNAIDSFSRDVIEPAMEDLAAELIKAVELVRMVADDDLNLALDTWWNKYRG